jgi:RHS repeat-associated protein
MQFSTKPYDDKTGLSYYGYRFYAPALGRWMTRDPIGERGGINLYGFVDNNPINYVDPDGRVIVIAAIPGILFMGIFSFAP